MEFYISMMILLMPIASSRKFYEGRDETEFIFLSQKPLHLDSGWHKV